jgi:hypothetical protein
MEIRKERGFPQWLEKSLANDARLFHSSHRPDGGDQFRLTSRVGPNEKIERGQIKLTESPQSRNGIEVLIPAYKREGMLAAQSGDPKIVGGNGSAFSLQFQGDG